MHIYLQRRLRSGAIYSARREMDSSERKNPVCMVGSQEEAVRKERERRHKEDGLTVLVAEARTDQSPVEEKTLQKVEKEDADPPVQPVRHTKGGKAHELGRRNKEKR